jgi:hypothetical protein
MARREIDLLRLVLDIDGIRRQACPRRNDARRHPQGQLDPNDTRAAVHVVDGKANRRRTDGVANRPDRLQEVGNFQLRRVVVD